MLQAGVAGRDGQRTVNPDIFCTWSMPRSRIGQAGCRSWASHRLRVDQPRVPTSRPLCLRCSLARVAAVHTSAAASSKGRRRRWHLGNLFYSCRSLLSLEPRPDFGGASYDPKWIVSRSVLRPLLLLFPHLRAGEGGIGVK